MKQFIWMLCGIFLSGLLLGTLSSCGDTQYGVTFVTTPFGAGTESVPEEDAGAVPAIPDTESRPVAENTDRNLAYGRVLWDAYLKGVLPDGTKMDYPGDELLGPIEGNEFALCDVDGDGEKELLLYWLNAITAGQKCVVYGWEGGMDVRQELCVYPSLTFYDNGIVTADWSHNQGWGGRFWPYSIYQYQEETGDYTQTMDGVDAWDIFCTEDTLPAAFPKDIDADGDGLVYFLLSGEWYGGEFTAPDGSVYHTWSVPPVDGPDYESWRDSFIGGAKEIGIPRQKLTEETIAALGCPKPDVAYPEPVG